MRKFDLTSVITEILRLEKKEYFLGSKVPATRLDACVLDVLRKLREDKFAIARRWREGARFLDRSIARFVLGRKFVDSFAIELLPQFCKRSVMSKNQSP